MFGESEHGVIKMGVNMSTHLRHILIVACFVLVFALLLSVLFTPPPLTRAAADASCQLTWQPVSAPAAGSENELRDVHALAANDVWAVGSFDSTSTLTEHWNGTTWSVVSSPNAATGTSALLAVHGIASDDVWAVGRNRISQTESRAILLHWDGSVWHTVPDPLPTTNHWLADIAASSANDVWAVGSLVDNTGLKNLVLHWNGSAWTQAPIGIPPQNPEALNAIEIIAPNDIWAAGAAIYHWDGTTWEMQKAVEVEDIAAFGANDVWFTGAGTNGFLHWNGAQWQTFAPGASPYVGVFHAIDGAASDDIYAVGDAYAHGSLGISQHFDGAQWNEIVTPATARNTYLNGVSVVSASEVWAVGSFSSFLPPPSKHSVILRGTAPCIVPTPIPTPTPIPLQVPVLLTPPNHSTVIVLRPVLDWRNVKNATSYRVQLREAFGTWQTKATVTNSEYKTPKLTRGKMYVWRVRACDATHCGKWSNYFGFTVK
jgi:hypothetical protein